MYAETTILYCEDKSCSVYRMNTLLLEQLSTRWQQLSNLKTLSKKKKQSLSLFSKALWKGQLVFKDGSCWILDKTLCDNGYLSTTLKHRCAFWCEPAPLEIKWILKNRNKGCNLHGPLESEKSSHFADDPPGHQRGWNLTGVEATEDCPCNTISELAMSPGAQWLLVKK